MPVFDGKFSCPDCGARVKDVPAHRSECPGVMPAPPEPVIDLSDAELREAALSVTGAADLVAEPKSATADAKARDRERKRRWREQNRDHNRAYMRDYMRRRRAKEQA